MKPRKLLATVLTLALTIPMVAPVLATKTETETTAGTGFRDTAGHWAEAAIERWCGYGVVQGDQNGNFNPDQPITRGSLATVMVNLLGLSKKPDTNPYADLSGDEWYAENVLKCTAAGIMEGDGTNCNAETNISRQEATVMYARALGVAPDANPDLSQFSDGAEVANWAAGAVSAMAKRGIITGVTSGKVAPAINIDRASNMAILDKAITSYITEPGTYTAKNSGITLVRSGDVTVTGSAEFILVAAGADGGTVDVSKANIAENVTVDASNATVKVSAGDVVVVNGKDTKSIVVGGSNSGGSGGVVDDDPMVLNYTYAEAKTLFSDEGAQGTVKQYIAFLEDPSYGTGNDAAFTALDLANTEIFVSKDFTLQPSLFPSLRNVASSCMTADRSQLWLAYRDGGVDCVDMTTGDTTNYSEGLVKGMTLLLVCDDATGEIYLITDRGVSCIKA